VPDREEPLWTLGMLAGRAVLQKDVV
jgi:hypothetical protein